MKFFNLAVILFFITLSSCSFQSSKEGQLRLKGLKDSVNVYTDDYGVAHIEAKNDEDMMFALGYTTASDRLFQMDLLRRIGSGKLSEVLGEKLLETDILLRKLGLRRHADFLWKKYKKTAPPKMLRQVNAYFNGVNSYIKKGPLPLEMRLLRYTPEEFTMEDTIAISGYLALSFAEGFIVDPLYSDLIDELKKEDLQSLFPRSHFDRRSNSQNVTKSTFKQNLKLNIDQNYFSKTASVLEKLKADFSLFHGSNSWLLAGSKTESGKAVLASDPHIAFAQPSVWYEVHIKSPAYENYGHYIPGIPFPGLAHNMNRAWGLTMSNSDDLDFYLEKLHPTDKSLVMFNGGYVKLKLIEEVIKIKGGKEHKETVLITPHGPILENSKLVKKGHLLSVKWAYLNPNNNSALTFYLLSQSKSLKDLAPALKHASAPGFNFMFADSEGSIGWHVMGSIPIKNRSGNGKEILEGHSGLDEYRGYLGINENPHVYNPSSGFIASANYKHQAKGQAPWIGLWQPKNRFSRINKLLKEKNEKWSLADLKKMQTEEHVIFYDTSFVNVIAKLIKPSSEIELNALKKLKKWDGSSGKKSFGASFYYTFFQFFLMHAFSDELGPERFKAYLEGADSREAFSNFLKNKNSALWDDINTKDVKETREEIIQKTFADTVFFLKNEFESRDLNKWEWGKLHTLTFNHPLGKFFPLTTLFNLGPYEVGGGAGQLNNMGHKKTDMNFDVVYGPSTRRLIDFKNPRKSLGVLPTGNSGNRFSKHYSDQIDLFLNNEYRELNMDMNAVKSSSHTKLELTPL
jgi:penicillin amidase